MTRITSDTVTVQKPASEIYSFLSNFNNFQKLMPEQVTNWQSTEEECSFTIAGMASLGMKIKDRTPNSLVSAVRHGKAPFDFELKCQIEEKDGASDVQILFDADLNPMLKMMTERPLTNFLNMLAGKLKEI